MRDECIDAVKTAAGRELKQSEIKDIETRIARNQRLLAVADRPRYLAMTPAMRLSEAAKLASKELLGEAEKKKQRVALTIQKHDAIENYMAQQKKQYGMTGLESLKRVLAFYADGKSNFQSIETRAHAISADYVRNLVGAFESISPKMLGLFSNKEGIRALVYEMFGQDSRKIASAEVAAMAKKGAEKWAETSGAARTHFNNAGGQIGILEDWHLPQQHSQRLVAAVEPREWINDHMGWVNRKKYVNEDGSLMNDKQLYEFLTHANETISTGGANKIEPGQVTGHGMAANANAEERSIHYKDAESWLAAQAKYGGKDAYTVMMSHVTSLAHEIAVLETLGPNPDTQFKYWLDKSVKDESLANPKKSGKVQQAASGVSDLYDYISGKTKPIANRRIAEGFDTLRNWLVATRLGSAFVTSITDNATMHLTAQVNGMSSMKMMRNQLQTMNLKNTDELRMARRAGLSLQTLMGEMNRWGSEALGPSFSSKLANVTIRASLLNAATEARRRAFGVTMYGSIGNTVKNAEKFTDIEANDMRMLKSKNITPADFAVWKKAELENWGNGNDNILTPESIYKIADKDLDGIEGNNKTLRREAALKLMGMVNEEINMAVPEPTATIKAMTKMGTQRGTWKGEITRSFFLFKSFPLAMIMNHWSRGLNMPSHGGKAAYLASFLAGTTILGAAAQQISNVISGRDPQDMTKGKFWAQSLMKGGSLGIYGDFLFQSNTSYGNTPLGVLAGPVAGALEDFIGLTQGSLVKMAQGQKADFAANLLRVIKTNIPLQNLWYTKAIVDRLAFNNLQEMVSPGYMQRMEQRAQHDYGQSFFWHPGSVLPSRAPNAAAAFGKK